MSLLPQFGFFELIIVAVVALVVVGPKDLPRLMRMAGGVVRQARALASEFVGAFNQMARETEMEEMRQEIEALKNDNVFADTKRSLDDAMKPIEDTMRSEERQMREEVTKPLDQSGAADAKAADAKKTGTEEKTS